MSTVGTASAQKTDTVVMNNGDRITCEIVKLERGRLEAKTDSLGTVLIEWDDVHHVSSRGRFEVELDSGERVVGTLGRTRRAREVVVGSEPPVTLDLDRVVFITPLNQSFWQQLDGVVDVGYDFAKAGESTQWTFSTQITRRTARLETRFTGDSFFSTRDGAEDTNRHSLALQVLRFAGPRWGLMALGQGQRNDELRLRLRAQLGGGVARRFVQTNQLLLGGVVGMAYSRESFTDETPVGDSAEVILGTQFQTFTFDTPKTDVSIAFFAFPNVSTWGRVRLEFDARVRRELVKDFFLNVTFVDSFDSEPPSPGAVRNDFSVVSSFGWSF